MQWDDLKYFLSVARTGSISSGAQKLEVQHSTVSRRIRKLEQKLQTKLLNRIQGGYQLTAAGTKVKSIAENIEKEIFEVNNIIGEEVKLSGELRVATLNNLASSILMPIFYQFRQEQPNVQLHINVSNNYASLFQREADVVIRLTNSPPETLIGKRILGVASTIYINKEYQSFCKANKQDPEWIGVTCCDFHKSWTKKECGERDFNFYSDDTILTLAAIRQGIGISYLPCFMGDQDPLLVRFQEPKPENEIGLWILYHPDFKHTSKIIAFKEFICLEVLKKSSFFTGKNESII